MLYQRKNPNLVVISAAILTILSHTTAFAETFYPALPHFESEFPLQFIPVPAFPAPDQNPVTSVLDFVSATLNIPTANPGTPVDEASIANPDTQDPAASVLLPLVGEWQGQGQRTKTFENRYLDVQDYYFEVIRFKRIGGRNQEPSKLAYTRTLTFTNGTDYVESGFLSLVQNTSQILQWYSSSDGYHVAATGTPDLSTNSIIFSSKDGGASNVGQYNMKLDSVNEISFTFEETIQLGPQGSPIVKYSSALRKMN